MTYKDLQIQILEDVVETCPQDSNMRHQGYHFFRLGSLVKRRRPEEMLETLRRLMTDDRVWPVKELLTGLGWPDTYGSRVSVGRAVALLGNKVSTQPRPVPTDLPERVAEIAFENCTSAELCLRLGLPTTQGFLTKCGQTLKRLGWKRHKTKRADGGVLWKWRSK